MCVCVRARARGARTEGIFFGTNSTAGEASSSKSKLKKKNASSKSN